MGKVAERIKLLAMDVDGVMTDGGIIVHDDGSESKKFNVRDGAWIRIWQREGFKTAIITGRECAAVGHRARQLQIDYYYQKAWRKMEVLEQLVVEAGVWAEEIAYIGDDVMDLPVIRRVGLGVAVADAVAEVRAGADLVTERAGGQGAVYELIEYLLGEKGLLDQAMARYRGDG